MKTVQSSEDVANTDSLNSSVRVLISSIGRRGYIAEYFNKIAGVTTYACDASPFASGLYAAHNHFVVPKYTAPDYIESIVNICHTNEIDLIISLNDYDLISFSKNQEYFKSIGTELVLSSHEVVMLCIDKFETSRFMMKNGIPFPETTFDINIALEWLNEDGDLIIKPRFGSGSVGVQIVTNGEELLFFNSFIKKSLNMQLYEAVDLDQKMIFQRVISGIEFGIDIVNDLKGNYVTSLVKRKLSMRSGETDQAMVVKNQHIENLAEKISNLTAHIANMDVDIIESDGVPYIIDLNPRFGGGYPFSYAAGLNIPEMIIHNTLNKPWKPGVIEYNQSYSKAISIARVSPE